MNNNDPYRITYKNVEAPPIGFKNQLKHLGPSLILSAAIVGSGELIATTTLGAKAGFVCLWIILFSCMVKVLIQLEFGRETLTTGKTAMQIVASVAGPKIGPVPWSIPVMTLITLFKMIQMGGIIGGVAITLNMLFSTINIPIFAIITALTASFLVYKGYYQTLQNWSMYMIACFTLVVFLALVLLQKGENHVTVAQIFTGFTFDLPQDALLFAVGAFGITGVGADEILHYNYWCLEKGYAAKIGPANADPERILRLKGWIKVMHIDALLAMAIYTTVTASFYILGAAILHGKAEIPEGYNMVSALSKIFTQTLGQWSLPIFLIGVVAILFSTVFASLAAWTRQSVDLLGQLYIIDFKDFNLRKRIFSILAWVLPLLWATLFIFIKLPTVMVLSGGVVGTFLLVLLVGITLSNFVASKQKIWYNSLYWLSVITILCFAVFTFWMLISKK